MADTSHFIFLFDQTGDPMQIATLTFSILAFATSSITLAVVLKGGHQMKTEMDEVKANAKATVTKLKNALNDLDL